jgi:DNA-binding CsgD family transcriptional regulator
LPDLVRLLVEGGDHARAAAFVDRVTEAAGPAGDVHTLLVTARLRALALVHDDPNLASRAASAVRDIGRPLVVADTLADAAVVLARNGEAPNAAPLIDEALATYDELGAVRPAARALAASRGAGLRARRFATRARPRTGWEALSPTELDVVRLVAEGLTNPGIGDRLFMSRRTAETHVRHALVKLGVATRVELAAAFRAHAG